MMAAAKATGDANYMKYVTDRFNFLAEVAPHFRELQEKSGQVDPQMKQILCLFFGPVFRRLSVPYCIQEVDLVKPLPV